MARTKQPSIFRPSENYSCQLSIRVSKEQLEKINTICQRYRLRKNDFFRQIVDEFFLHHNLKKHGNE